MAAQRARTIMHILNSTLLASEEGIKGVSVIGGNVIVTTKNTVKQFQVNI